MLSQQTIQQAIKIFGAHGGNMRTKKAIQAGIHPRTIYAMRDSGYLKAITRGLYRLADMPPLSDPDLAAVSLKIPKGVICLISALAIHELTTQAPNEVHLTIPRNTRRPRLDIPIKIYRFSGDAYSEGIEVRQIDGVEMKVYGPEKTIADCFKYRNRIGVNIAIEAVQEFRRRKEYRREKVLEFAQICRVEKIVRPHLHTSQ